MNFVERIVRARRQRRVASELQQLDGYLLADIGLDGFAVRRMAAGKDFGRLQGLGR